jgi:hypothetical protein
MMGHTALQEMTVSFSIPIHCATTESSKKKSIFCTKKEITGRPHPTTRTCTKKARTTVPKKKKKKERKEML